MRGDEKYALCEEDDVCLYRNVALAYDESCINSTAFAPSRVIINERAQSAHLFKQPFGRNSKRYFVLHSPLRMAIPWSCLQFLLLLLLSAVDSKPVVVVYRMHPPEERYQAVALESRESNLARCSLKCTHADPKAPCKAFNFRPSDGSCQLIVDGDRRTVPADGYLAFTRREFFLYAKLSALVLFLK